MTMEQPVGKSILRSVKILIRFDVEVISDELPNRVYHSACLIALVRYVMMRYRCLPCYPDVLGVFSGNFENDNVGTSHGLFWPKFQFLRSIRQIVYHSYIVLAIEEASWRLHR